MANKHVLSTADAEYVRHQIGNPIFAIETSLVSLRSRLMICSTTESMDIMILDAIQKSIETMKERLHDLDVSPDPEVRFEEFDAEDGPALIPIEQFKQHVIGAALMSEDGTGYYVTDKVVLGKVMESTEQVDLGDIKANRPLPLWATHVAWYNK